MPRSLMDAAERNKHRDMMLTPLRWPRWPWLPVKKRESTWNLCGSIYADDTEEGKPVTVILSPKLNPGDPLVYTDVDAVLDDGWVVD